MIQTKEELFIAELGGNPQQEIELSYGAKIKITDLLSKYLEAINYTHCCKSDSEQFNCYEMHAYSRFAGCTQQCKECADNEKSEAI